MSSWQDVLWALPTDMGPWWYIVWGAVGVVAAALIFAVAIYGHGFSAMLIWRATFCAGLFLIPLAALNSGWQPWIPAVYAASAIIGALSLAVERCDREMEITTVGAALAEKVRRAFGVIRGTLGRLRRPRG